MQPHNFFSTDATPTPTRRHALGRSPTPPPLPENLLLRLHRKLPSAPPASTQEVSESENPPATRGTAHSEVQGDARCTTRCTARCNDRPIAALHFLLPTGDSRSGRRSFDSKLNLPSPARRGSRSRPPLRRPRPLRLERLRVPVWNPYRRGRLSPAKVGRSKERRRKNRRQSHIFFSTCCAWHPNSPPGPGEAPHPAPSARKSVIRLHRKLPSAPLRAPRRFRNPKIGQQLGAQPTPRFRVMLDAMLDAMFDHGRPSLFGAHRP